jgi:hypothetical protein
LVLAGVLLGSTNLYFGSPAPTEYEIKAAYLYDFGKFVQWPVRSKNLGGFAICVLGVDPFGRVLDETVAGQTIGGESVVVRRIDQPIDAGGCRILFVSSSEATTLKSDLEALKESSILTVSDMPQFTQRGGMIHFLTEDRRVRFDINQAAATRAGLRLSSQLLKVAVSVTGSGQPGD